VPVLIPAALLAIVNIATKTHSGHLAAKRAGIGRPGRWRTGLTLTPLAAAYVLTTIIVGPLLARLPDTDRFETAVPKRAPRASAPKK